MRSRGEKIFFLIKSKTDEYCFTNDALLHLDGDTAFRKKRLLNGGDGNSADQVRDLYNFYHTRLKDAKNEVMRRDYASVFEPLFRVNVESHNESRRYRYV